MSVVPSSTIAVAAGTADGAWRAALPALALVIAAIVVLYWQTATDMVSIWARSNAFSHAFLVPPVVAWLVWRQRGRVARIAPSPNAWALLPVAGAAALWLLGELAAVNAAMQFAFVALLVLAVPAVLGTRVARALAFPLAFAFFAVPIGDFLLPWLMRMTADVTVFALRASGVPVFREGMLFVIPSGNWSVVEACSGVRYLIASLMVGTLYAGLMYRSTRRRLVFMAVALLVPVVANWVRAYLIVMLGHLSNNRIATGVDHVIYGWLFFGVVIFVLYLVGGRWTEHWDPAAEPMAARLATAVSPVRPWLTALVAAGVVLLAFAPSSVYRGIVEGEPAAVPTLDVPATLAEGWRASPRPAADWHPALANPSAQIDTAYLHDGLPAVGLHVAYYRGQDGSRKLADVDAARTQSEDPRWARVSEGRAAVAEGARTLDVRTATWRDRSELNGGVEPGVVAWQFYWAGGRFTDSASVAKASVALDRLRGRGDDSAEIVVYAHDPVAGAAELALEDFLRANLSAIEQHLNQVRSHR